MGRKLAFSHSQPRTLKPSLGHLPTQRACRMLCLNNGCCNTGVHITGCPGSLLPFTQIPKALGRDASHSSASPTALGNHHDKWPICGKSNLSQPVGWPDAALTTAPTAILPALVTALKASTSIGLVYIRKEPMR